jgi:hypothetical protein
MLFEQFRTTIAAQMGVPASQVQLTGIHTDNDQVIGCGDSNTVGGGFSVTVDDDYLASLGSSDALADCMIDADEIASDPEAAAMVQAIVEAQAAALGVDPSTITITGLHTDGDDTPGCNQNVGSTVSLDVDPAYLSALASSDALADCWISQDEIDTDPEAATLAQQFILSTASQLNVSPSSIQITGFSTDGDSTPGCGNSVSNGMTVQVNADYASSLGTTDALADCWISQDEIASDADAASLAAAFRASTAAQLGVDPSAVVVSGFGTQGNMSPGCPPGSGRRQLRVEGSHA